MADLKESVRLLRELLWGATFMGGSYPGPEPGKLYSLSTSFPDDKPNQGKKRRVRSRRSGREREEPRWQKP
jgi:hypothetical protein